MIPQLEQEFVRQLGAEPPLFVSEVSGGCVSRAMRVRDASGKRWFAKLNSSDRLTQFEAERCGLARLRAAAALRLPAPLYCGRSGDLALLVTEWLDLEQAGDWAKWGRALARQHSVTAAALDARLDGRDRLPEGFGTDFSPTSLGQREGYVGFGANWAEHYCMRRLEFQFDQARVLHGREFPARARVIDVCLRELPANPLHSLVHGDLWCGNAAFCGGEPAAYDPDAQIAHGETDVALSMLFGGFSPQFAEAYFSELPAEPGWELRCDMYNLYHALNHFNLFGAGYLGMVERLAKRVCQAARK